MRRSAVHSRITALAYRFNNADGAQIEAAAANLTNRCAAFWHSASSGNAVVGGFMPFLNRAQDVKRAWKAYEDTFRQPSRMRAEAMLDKLLPLNEAAVHSLLDAYLELDEPTFRTARELFARTDKADVEALAALRAIRPNGVLPLDFTRVDEAARAINREAITAKVAAGAVRLADVVGVA